MNNKLLIAGAAIATISVSTLAIAASDNGTATATIQAPIAITNTSDLQFGDIVAAAGTVTIAADGTPSGLPSGGTQSAGTFDLTGEPSKTFSIVIATVADLTDGTDTLPLSAYTNDAGGAIGTMDVSGSMTMGVGATITVEADDVAGGYTGTYSVTVVYN